jgi:hypothetical protein
MRLEQQWSVVPRLLVLDDILFQNIYSGPMRPGERSKCCLPEERGFIEKREKGFIDNQEVTEGW